MGAREMTLEELKWVVAHLSHEDLARFREWFEEFDAALWDQEFERDVREGRLDKVAEQAIKDFRQGRYKEL